MYWFPYLAYKQNKIWIFAKSINIRNCKTNLQQKGGNEAGLSSQTINRAIFHLRKCIPQEIAANNIGKQLQSKLFDAKRAQ